MPVKIESIMKQISDEHKEAKADHIEDWTCYFEEENQEHIPRAVSSPENMTSNEKKKWQNIRNISKALATFNIRKQI